MKPKIIYIYSFQRNPHLLTSIALLVQHMHVVSTFNGDVSILRLEFNFEMSFVWWHFCKFWYQIQITEGWMVKTKNTSMPLLTCSRKKHSIKTIHMTSFVEKNIQTRHYIHGLNSRWPSEANLYELWLAQKVYIWIRTVQSCFWAWHPFWTCCTLVCCADFVVGCMVRKHR